MGEAIAAVASLETIEADAVLLRRTMGAKHGHALGEIAPEHRDFKCTTPRFIAAFTFEGRPATAPLRRAVAILAELGGDRRIPLPAEVPTTHIERRWHPYLFREVRDRDGRVERRLDRTRWELATVFALSGALASGDVWVPCSRLHRSLDVLLGARSDGRALAAPAVVARDGLPDVDDWLDARAAQLDGALLAVSRRLPKPDSSKPDAVLFAGDRLRFPKEPKTDLAERDRDQRLAQRAYGLVPPTRITDVLSQVERWTGFVQQFGHVSTGLPPSNERTFLAALIAEATNLGITRMAEVCGIASRRALLRMQTWHMREDTFRAALGCLTDAIHAEPLSAWFGEDWRASADGQAFALGGPGEAGGLVNAHYGRGPVVKIHTHHHRSLRARPPDRHGQHRRRGGARARRHLRSCQRRRPLDAPRRRRGCLRHGVRRHAPARTQLRAAHPALVGPPPLYLREPAPLRTPGAAVRPAAHRDLISGHWDEIGQVVRAVRDRTVTPSLVLRKLSAYRQQKLLAAALREVGRIERTLFTLRWYQDPELRRLVTAELNKGEARSSLARAVAFHRLGRFRDRGLENQRTRAAAPTLVTAAIILFNCRYLSRALDALRRSDGPIDDAVVARLSPLGWDRIDLTGDYVWSDAVQLDKHGLMPLQTSTAAATSVALP